MQIGEDGVMLLSVLYKLPRERKPCRADWVVKDLKELMDRLARDGVTRESVEYLYVHYSPRGTMDVLELVAVDNSAPGSKEKKESSNVIPFPKKEEVKAAVEKTTKPRIRLKGSACAAVPTASSYLYTAQQV